jgi:hypothetical protein
LREAPVKSSLLTYLLLVGLGASLFALVVHLRAYPLPGNQQGYAPTQPIAFSHQLHAGKLEMACTYCHYAALHGPHAGIPPASLCMNCHRLVTASWDSTRAELEKAQQERRTPRRTVSPDLQKLYDALRLDDKLQPIPGKSAEPIRWIKVHNLPDYTRFDHRAHVQAGMACQECHGPVQTMAQIHQAADLSMGWCVNCHREPRKLGPRDAAAATDCAACHY